MYSFNLKFNISLKKKKKLHISLGPWNQQLPIFLFQFSNSTVFSGHPMVKTLKHLWSSVFKRVFKPTSSKYQPCDLEQIRQPDNQFGYQLTHIK